MFEEIPLVYSLFFSGVVHCRERQSISKATSNLNKKGLSRKMPALL